RPGGVRAAGEPAAGVTAGARRSGPAPLPASPRWRGGEGPGRRRPVTDAASPYACLRTLHPPSPHTPPARTAPPGPAHRAPAPARGEGWGGGYRTSHQSSWHPATPAPPAAG